MDKKLYIIILIIFSAGFFTRLETVELNTVDKSYFTDENGLPYMYEPDSYYNYRLTAHILDHGHPGDRIINGKPWDLHSHYPPGGPVDYPPLILWITIIFYKFLNLFTVTDLMEACFWLPAILGPLAGIPIFFFVRRYAGSLAGLFAGVLVVLAPSYFVRTVPGFYDTDIFIIFFPVLVAFFFSKAIETNRNMPAVLSSLSLAIFSLAWNGWGYIFYIIILSSIPYIILSRIRGGKITGFLKRLTIFIIVSLTIIFLLGRLGYLTIFSTFFRFAVKPLAFNGWPDVHGSISELQAPGFDEFLSAAGPLNMFLGLFGIIIVGSIMLRDELRRIHLPRLTWYPFILILTWLIIGNLAYYMAARFALLAIPPLTICTGLLFGVMGSYLKHSPFKRLKKSRKPLILALVVLLSMISVVQASEIRLPPCIDDDFVLACSWIKNETPQSTVIISEWSYGHPIAAFSQRPVLIDGGRQTLRNYWVDHAFAVNNESLSIGIFRMLSTSGDKPIKLLENKTGSTRLTVKILDDILGVDKEKAGRILEEKYNMDPIFAERLLSYTHPTKKQPFIILTCDNMILAGRWYFYYGGWDFNKSRGHTGIYSIGSSNDTGRIRRYSNNVTLDLDTGGSWENKRPYNTLIRDGNSTRLMAGDKESNFIIIFLLDKNWSIIMDKSFRDSLFVKLVIFKEETRNFKPVYTNNSTIVWVVE